MNVQFIPANIDGEGCYRCIFPAAYLSDKGHTAGIPGFVLSDNEGREVKPLPGGGLGSVPAGDFNVHLIPETIPTDADVYVIQMGTHRWQYEWMAKWKAEGLRVVVDLDDDVHRVPKYNPGQLSPSSDKDVNRRWAQRCVELADAVSVATPELARFYGRWNDDVTVIPNYLHWPMWAPLAPVYERAEWRRFRVGYMGNSDYHSEDLRLIAGPLRRWLEDHSDVEFVAAGDPRLHDIVGTPEGQQVTTSKVWFRNLDLACITSCFDVGLAPLVANDFNEAKSCLKGMEYNACGIPVLASPTEEYRRWVSGANGFLCKHPRDFTEKLDELYEDRPLLVDMGRESRKAARLASLDKHIEEWEQFFGRVCDNSVSARTRVAA